jgi:hypothetical protein
VPDISGEETMKSAEARLHATGMFHTTAMRSSALMSGSCGSGSSGSQKKMNEVDLVARNLRADLLVAAQGATLQPVDLQVELLLQHASCCSGCVKDVLCQQVAVELRPVEQVLLLVIMRYECDLLTRSHQDNPIVHSALNENLVKCSFYAAF